MPFLRRFCLAALFTVAATLSANAQAPGIGVDLAGVNARHELLGQLLGPVLHLDFPVGDRTLTMRLNAERLTGTSQRTGTACVGLRPPGNECSTEPLRDEARLISFAGGLAVPLIRRQLSITLVGDLRLAQAWSHTQGQTSGRTLGATKLLKGADAGVEAVWAPWMQQPLALEGGLLIGGLAPVIRDDGADGYWPFRNEFQVRTFRVGLVWRGAMASR